MSATEIKQMPRLEKIKLMQELWQDLTFDPDTLSVPEWHLTELRETETRFLEGKEEVLDWQSAKKQLREMF